MFSNYNYTSLGGKDDGYALTMVMLFIIAILVIAIIGSSAFISKNPDAPNISTFIAILVVSCVLLVLMAVGYFLVKRYNFFGD